MSERARPKSFFASGNSGAKRLTATLPSAAPAAIAHGLRGGPAAHQRRAARRTALTHQQHRAWKMHCECKKGKELRRVRGGKGRCVCSSPAAVSDADTRRPARRELPTVTRRLAIGRSSAEVVFSKVRAAGLVVLGAEHRAAAMEPSSGPAGAAKPERRVRLGNLRANIA
jgi:hypothetical protein